MAKEHEAELEKKDKAKKNTKSNKVDANKTGGMKKWFKDLKSELDKVVWPSFATVRNNTGVVLATVIITSVFVGALDFGLLKLIDFLYNR